MLPTCDTYDDVNKEENWKCPASRKYHSYTLGYWITSTLHSHVGIANNTPKMPASGGSNSTQYIYILKYSQYKTPSVQSLSLGYYYWCSFNQKFATGCGTFIFYILALGKWIRVFYLADGYPKKAWLEDARWCIGRHFTNKREFGRPSHRMLLNLLSAKQKKTKMLFITKGKRKEKKRDIKDINKRKSSVNTLLHSTADTHARVRSLIKRPFIFFSFFFCFVLQTRTLLFRPFSFTSTSFILPLLLLSKRVLSFNREEK